MPPGSTLRARRSGTAQAIIPTIIMAPTVVNRMPISSSEDAPKLSRRRRKSVLYLQQNMIEAGTAPDRVSQPAQGPDAGKEGDAGEKPLVQGQVVGGERAGQESRPAV